MTAPGRRIIVPGPRVYGYRYYSRAYPRPYYGYGSGSAFAFGFYYDPLGSYPRRYYTAGFADGLYGYAVGELRLRVEPRHAEVWVDGYYAGIVDDFDGTFQGLKLEVGEYHIEIVAAGYEPLELDVRISPGRKITYRGELIVEAP